MYLFIVFCYPHHYKTFATATSNTIGGHLGKGKNVQVGIKAVYLSVYLSGVSILFPASLPPGDVEIAIGRVFYAVGVV
jgi:hypothetical protein